MAMKTAALFTRPSQGVWLLLALLMGAPIELHAQRFHFPPVILSQPTNQVVAQGATNVVFTVVAQSSDPLQYQWRFNGTDLPGKTSSKLELKNVTKSSEGDYSVLVKTIVESKVSSTAHLTVVVRAPNDAFTNRIEVTGAPVTVRGNNVEATEEEGEPAPGPT